MPATGRALQAPRARARFATPCRLSILPVNFNHKLSFARTRQSIDVRCAPIDTLGIKGGIEDILITLDTQYHVIRPSTTKDGLFIYLVLDKSKANLAMARYKVTEVEQTMTV